MSEPTISLAALLSDSDADAHALLQAADVVLGVDATSHEEFVVHGLDVLESIIELGDVSQARRVEILRVEVDLSSVERGQLPALVEALKARSGVSA